MDEKQISLCAKSVTGFIHLCEYILGLHKETHVRVVPYK